MKGGDVPFSWERVTSEGTYGIGYHRPVTVARGSTCRTDGRANREDPAATRIARVLPGTYARNKGSGASERAERWVRPAYTSDQLLRGDASTPTSRFECRRMIRGWHVVLPR